MRYMHQNQLWIYVKRMNGNNIIRFKEGSIPTLYKEFKEIVAKDNESKKDNYEYVTKLDYQEENVNIIRHKDVKKGTEYIYITDLPISNKNIEETINLGRKRWKIENEGFNIQKMEHLI